LKIEKNILLNEAKSVLENQMQALDTAKTRLDDNFLNALDLLFSANKVITTGIGKSGLIAKKITATLTSIGVPSVFLHPVEALHGDIGIITEGDVLIALSKSGSTQEIINLLPNIKSRNIPTIGILGNMDSYLSRNLDISIDGSIIVEAGPLNLAPTTSTSIALAIGDALAVCLMKMKNITTEDFAKLHPQGQIGRNVTLQVLDVMHYGVRLPAIKPSSKFRDAVIEISQKDLGCVCVIDPANKLLGILTDGDVRRVLHNNDDIRGMLVKDVMTKNPISIKKDAFLGEALTIMESRERQISVLPVVDDTNKCIGLIRIHDILKSY